MTWDPIPLALTPDYLKPIRAMTIRMARKGTYRRFRRLTDRRYPNSRWWLLSEQDVRRMFRECSWRRTL